jgi:hypothetical protein
VQPYFLILMIAIVLYESTDMFHCLPFVTVLKDIISWMKNHKQTCTTIDDKLPDEFIVVRILSPSRCWIASTIVCKFAREFVRDTLTFEVLNRYLYRWTTMNSIDMYTWILTLIDCVRQQRDRCHRCDHVYWFYSNMD